MKRNDRRTSGVPRAVALLAVFAAACNANTARQIPSLDRRSSADVSCAVDLTDLRTTSDDYLLRFTALTTGVNNEIGKVDRTATPRAQDVMNGALGKLILGVNTDPSYTIQAAQDMIARVLAAQNMDPSSANFGQIPWSLDVPPPPSEDANRTEFAMQPMGTILSRWGGCLDQSFIADAIPHIQAAIAALRGHADSPIPVSYTNIYLMNTMNLILLGEAIGDADTAAQGYGQLDTWISYTRDHGIAEFVSPTYYSTDLYSLLLGNSYAASTDARGKFKSILDLFWTDIAANYFPGSGNISGAHSRDYDFLTGHGGVDNHRSIVGLGNVVTPASADAAQLLQNEVDHGYFPDAGTLALTTGERVIRGRHGLQEGTVSGTLTGKDHYNYLNDDVALGSSSSDYGPQDKNVNLVLNSAGQRIPSITVVFDQNDSPYGTQMFPDGSGHLKPLHETATRPVSVQERGTLFSTFYLAPVQNPTSINATSFATNIVFPLAVDLVTLNGVPQDLGTSTIEIRSAQNDVLGVRRGTSCAAFRVFQADGICIGQRATYVLQVDSEGRSKHAGRYTVYHYRGAEADLRSCRSKIAMLILAASCSPDSEGLQALTDALANARVSSTLSGSPTIWTASATIGDTFLEQQRDLSRNIYYRRVNGMDYEVDSLSVNGVDEIPLLEPPSKRRGQGGL